MSEAFRVPSETCPEHGGESITAKQEDKSGWAVDALTESGCIAKQLPDFEVRPQQIEMAQAVAAAFDAGEHLLVEAGTGVGKSFAYLVPAIDQAIRLGKRVVISTHTIALQEQLVEKDIPFLKDALPNEFSAVLVKGRSNYLSLRRLQRASSRQGELFESEQELDELHGIEDWAYKTTDGSLADLAHQPDAAVWDRVKSDADDCFGRRCPQFLKCFYQRARRQTETAQLLIVNHAMLFSDLAIRREGASVLPDYKLVVLDEAHTVERVAGDHLGNSISSVQLNRLFNSLSNERTGKGLLRGKSSKQAVEAVGEARRAAADYFFALETLTRKDGETMGRLREPPEVEEPVTATLVELRQRLLELRKEREKEDERMELEAAMERCAALSTAVRQWHRQEQEEWVYWVEVGSSGRRTTLNSRPVDVGPVLKASLFDPVESVVLTSATLTTSGKDGFAYLRSRLGLTDTQGLALGSPFNYREQVTVYLPDAMPDPSDGPAYITKACAAIRQYVKRSDGGAFVLFTSYAMLRQCADLLAGFFEEQKMPLLVQGRGLPRSKMLERFRAVPRSVLFGADTFWAGVDVPGQALCNVIIVKLPFAVPNHPVTEARIERIQQQGGKPFMDYQVPEAILKLKQGIGRLIRSRRDTGMIVILDPRVRTKGYGKRFLKALPDCRVVIEAIAEEVQASTPTGGNEADYTSGADQGDREC